jgi:hypothetical protein
MSPFSANEIKFEEKRNHLSSKIETGYVFFCRIKNNIFVFMKTIDKQKMYRFEGSR